MVSVRADQAVIFRVFVEGREGEQRRRYVVEFILEFKEGLQQFFFSLTSRVYFLISSLHIVTTFFSYQNPSSQYL